MKIAANKPLTNLKGEVLKSNDEPFTVGHALAEILVAATEGGKMKMYILAQRFFSEKQVELDAADKELVKTAVERTTLYNNMVTGQLLMLLGEE